MTQPDLDKVISRWTRLGIFFGASPARRSPDLERLLLDTARLVPANPRLFYLAVTWLSRYSNFVARHRLKHLVECDLEPDVQPGLGVLLALAIKHGASRELRIAADICAPAEVPRPVFNVQRRSRELEQLARERASDEGLGWNLWVPDQPPKLDALRPTHWLIANNPSYLERIVRKGDLRCSILLTLRHDVPGSTVESEMALARLCSANRLAVHKALDDLEYEGYELREQDPGSRSRRIVLTPPVVPMASAS